MLVALLAVAVVAGSPTGAGAVEPARDVYELDLPAIGASAEEIESSRDRIGFVATAARHREGGSLLGALTPGAAIAAAGALAAIAGAGIVRALRERAD